MKTSIFLAFPWQKATFLFGPVQARDASAWRAALLATNLPASLGIHPWLEIEIEVYGGFHSHGGTPKSSIFMGFSIINHPFWVPPFVELPICIYIYRLLAVDAKAIVDHILNPYRS